MKKIVITAVSHGAGTLFIKIPPNFSFGDWRHICAGSIINEWTVVTAAHCFTEPFNPENYIYVPGLHEVKLPRVNSPKEWNLTTHRIHQVFRPKGWDEDTLRHDLAIVIMKTPFKFIENFTEPIKLDNRSNLHGWFDLRTLQNKFQMIQNYSIIFICKFFPYFRWKLV